MVRAEDQHPILRHHVMRMSPHPVTPRKYPEAWYYPLTFCPLSSPSPPHPRRSLQLRPLAAALRKGDEPQGVLTALSRLGVLLRARPSELVLVAADLVRALMHCRVPEWAEAEAKR